MAVVWMRLIRVLRWINLFGGTGIFVDEDGVNEERGSMVIFFFFTSDFCIYNFNCLRNCVLRKVDINGRLKF